MSSQDDWILNARVHVPDHVVRRDFPGETMILNTETGGYYWLNRVGGRMLQVMTESASVSDALTRLTHEYGHDQAVIERDGLNLCRELHRCGLISYGERCQA